MDFFNQEINFDLCHLILFLAIFGLIFYVLFYRNKNEKLDVQPVQPTLCKCPSCAEMALQQVQNNELYGCTPDSLLLPHSDDECLFSYRKQMLHGCAIA